VTPEDHGLRRTEDTFTTVTWRTDSVEPGLPPGVMIRREAGGWGVYRLDTRGLGPEEKHVGSEPTKAEALAAAAGVARSL
jgi:hypothetical protein